MKDPKPNRVMVPAAAETAPGKAIQSWPMDREPKPNFRTSLENMILDQHVIGRADV